VTFTPALDAFALDVAALLGLGSPHLLRRISLGLKVILEHDPDTGAVREATLHGARLFQSSRPSAFVEVWLPDAAVERLRYWLPSQDASAFASVLLSVRGDDEHLLWRFAAGRCAFTLAAGLVNAEV